MHKLKGILKILNDKNNYVIYCFGTSVFSNLIMAMTKIKDNEQVPSHILLKIGNIIVESSSESFNIFSKFIKEGVRVYTVEDFIDNELPKKTLYQYKKINIGKNAIERIRISLNKKYSYKTIEDYIFCRDIHRDDYICSGFVNFVLNAVKTKSKRQVSPAEIYRKLGTDKVGK